MDNELSNAMTITIDLIVISAVIGIIMLFIGIGQQFQRSTLASVTDVVASGYASEIGALKDNEGPLPVATVYLIIERNLDLVESVTGTIQRKMGDGTVQTTTITNKEDLKEFFDMKGKVTVTDASYERVEVRVEGPAPD